MRAAGVINVLERSVPWPLPEKSFCGTGFFCWNASRFSLIYQKNSPIGAGQGQSRKAPDTTAGLRDAGKLVRRTGKTFLWGAGKLVRPVLSKEYRARNISTR